MKEKNKSKFYVKVLIVITIIACILSGIFFILQNNTELIQEVDEIASKKATEVIYINTESDLITFRNNVNSGNNRNATVYLTSNIAIDSEWKPISNFGGKFDGLGHTISGIQNDENDYGGLFGTTSGAEIRNVKIDDTTIAEIGGGGFTYGALINIANNTKIYNCCVQYSTIRSNGIAGGIVGEANSSQISKCYNNQSAVNSGIESVDGAGGIAGRAENTTIEYCYNRGQVKALSPGGIVGGALPRRGVTIKYCYNVGSVQFSASVMDNDVSYPGAISCVSDDTITNCYFLAGTGTAYGAATSKTDSQLKNSTIISSLGGTSIWKMGTTSSYYYPVLLWQVDSTGPKVNLEYNYNFDNPPIISELSMTINASDTESGLDDLNEYEYCFSKSDKSLAGVRWQKYTPGQNMTIYPDVSGDYYIIIKQVYDNAGNIGKIANGSNIYSSAGTTTIGGREYIIAPGKPIKFDVEGPDIWITSNSFYFKTPTQVTIKATDDVEIKIAQYKIDTGSWQDIGGDTKELTETITISKTCTVYLEVTDTAGATNSCSYNFIVDSTPPTITGFEDGQWHNTEITATANDENIDTDQLRYYYSASYIASVNFDQLIPTKSKSKKFSEEGYYFVGACDKVGNQSKIYSFKIEKTKASIVNVVKKPEDWTSGDVTITVTLSDVLSGYEYIQPRNDDEDYRESVKSDSIKINGNVCEFTVTENGTYVISAKTKSGFSQLDLEEVAVVDKIDKTYPTDNEPSVTATTDTITVTRNNQTDTGSGIETSKTQYGYRKKNEANANYTWGNSATISGLQDDTEYEVVTKSTDKVGHTTTSRPATIRTESADKNPPTISAKPENQNTYVKSVNVVLTIDEEVKEGELQYIWTTSNSNTAPGGSWSVTTIKNKTATVSKTDSNGIYYLWVGQVTDNHGNTSDKKRFGPYYLDVTGPQFKVTRTPNGWTTEDVTLKIIDVTDNGKIANTDPYQFGSDGWTSSTTKVYHENAGSINVYVRDEAGNIGTYNIAVTNIDRTPPTITEAKNTATGYTKDKTTLSGKAQDTLSGINGWQFSKENNITKDSNGWQTINATTESITQTQEISENGTWYFYVKDQAGNVRKSSAITVDKIEKASDVKIPKITGKVGNNDYASNSWTNQTVTLTVNGTASSGVSGYKYQKNGIGGWIDCDGAKKDTLTISEAGTTKIKAKTVSNTGLESGESQEFTVNIDRTAPTCTITAVPDPGESNWTNSENITYTFEFSETVTGFTENSIQVSKEQKEPLILLKKTKNIH